MILSSLGLFVLAEDDTGQKTGTEFERHRLYEEEKSLYEKIWLNEDVRPLMLGFAGTSDSPYGGAHMTVCVGYEISSNGIRYVYVSDAIHTSYQKIEFRPETYNDFIAKVNVGAIMED